jgi:hypothetical protein
MLKTIDTKIMSENLEDIEFTKEELVKMTEYVEFCSGNREEYLVDLLNQYIKYRIVDLVNKEEFYYIDNYAQEMELYNLAKALRKIEFMKKIY